MMLFHIPSTAMICLWSLLLAIGPIYTPISTIPALISPVLTPLLSPADGPTILILTEVCDAAVHITLPACDPSEVPVRSSGPPGVLCSRRALQLVASALVLGYVGVVLCATQLADEAGCTTSTPSHHPAQPAPALPSIPCFPPPSREAGPIFNMTPLSQAGASECLRLQVLTRTNGVSTSDQGFRSSPVDSGYDGSPLPSRGAAPRRHQSRLRLVFSVGVDSPVPSGPVPATELGSGGDGVPLGCPPTAPLSGSPTLQCFEDDWTSCVATNDPLPTTGTSARDSTSPNLGGRRNTVTLNTPSRNCTSNPTGFSPAPGVTTPFSVERKGVSGRKMARETRDAFLRFQAERGHAAPSRLYCSFVNERSVSSVARMQNIRALRDILDSGKVRLRKIREMRSAWLSLPNTRSMSPNRSSNQVSCTAHIPSAPSRASLKSLYSQEQGPSGLDERKTTLDLPTELVTLVGEELSSDVDDPSPLSETPFANPHKRTSEVLAAKTLDHPALTSMDIGLRLLQQAISERGGRSWYREESKVSFETSVSVDLSLGRASSFLDDIPDLPVLNPLLPLEVRNEQATWPTLLAYTLPIAAPPSDVPSEDVVIIHKASPLGPWSNQTPFPPAPSFENSLSFGWINGCSKDISSQFSRPVVTFKNHDTYDPPSSFSFDSLELANDTTPLMDQSAPLSQIESPTCPGPSIPPFEELISRVHVQKVAMTTQKDQGLTRLQVLGRRALQGWPGVDLLVHNTSVRFSSDPPTTLVLSFKDIVQGISPLPAASDSSSLLDFSSPGFRFL